MDNFQISAPCIFFNFFYRWYFIFSSSSMCLSLFMLQHTTTTLLVSTEEKLIRVDEAIKQTFCRPILGTTCFCSETSCWNSCHHPMFSHLAEVLHSIWHINNNKKKRANVVIHRLGCGKKTDARLYFLIEMKCNWLHSSSMPSSPSSQVSSCRSSRTVVCLLRDWLILGHGVPSPNPTPSPTTTTPPHWPARRIRLWST